MNCHNNFERVQSSASSSELRLRLRTSPPTRTLHVADQCSVAANRRFGHLQNLFASLYFTASAKSFAAQFLPLVVLISDGGFSTWRRQTLWKMTEQKNSKRSVSLDGGRAIYRRPQTISHSPQLHSTSLELSFNIVFNFRKLSKNIWKISLFWRTNHAVKVKSDKWQWSGNIICRELWQCWTNFPWKEIFCKIFKAKQEVVLFDARCYTTVAAKPKKGKVSQKMCYVIVPVGSKLISPGRMSLVSHIWT